MKTITGIAAFLLIINVLISILLRMDAVLSVQNLVSILEMLRDGITITGIVAIMVVAVVAIRDSGQQG
jgi:arginine exporter protein ArgO